MPSRFMVFAAWGFCRWKRGLIKAELSTLAVAKLSEVSQGLRQFSLPYSILYQQGASGCECGGVCVNFKILKEYQHYVILAT